MDEPSSDIAFTPAVKGIQARRGSRQAYEAMERRGGWKTRISPDLAAFIAARDSFYIATANAAGQPYIQHRGGKAGFLKILDDRRLAFADFRGNRQYITAGNLSENDKAYLFLIDYPGRRRIKIWGRAAVVEDDALIQRLADADYDGRPEQAIVFEVAAWDVNCPQHITPRYTQDEVDQIIEPLRQRIKALEMQLEAKITTLSPLSMEQKP